jgi:peptide/nickel transport system substrate-binding protein
VKVLSARARWRSRIVVGAAACAAAAMLAACSGNPGSTSSSGTGTATPVRGGTLTYVTPTLESLDPQGALAQDTGDSIVAKAVFSRLVVLDNGKLAPQLATKWTTSANGLTWTFTLDPKAKFSDGAPVTSADVKASLQRVITLKGVNAALFAAVTRMSTPSAHVFTLTTAVPVGTLLSSLTLLYIAPADKINQPAFWNKPIGSGPFMVQSYQTGNQVVLVRNPHYWGTPAYLNKVVLTVIPEVADQVTALQAGEVDIVSELPEDQVATVSGTGTATVVYSPSQAILSLWFNNAVAPFTNPKVRQAMWYAVNWNSIQKSLYGKTATMGRAPIASGVSGFSPQAPYSYDPTKAKSLLAAAGLSGGFSTTIKYVPTAVPQIQLALQAAASQWASVGIKVTLVPQQTAVWTSDLLAMKWNMEALENTSRTGEADQILGRLYTSKAKRLGFADPAYDQFLASAESSLKPSARDGYYAKAEQILWSQAVGNWPLQLKATYAVSTRVHGFVADPSSVPDFSSVWVSGSGS